MRNSQDFAAAFGLLLSGNFNSVLKILFYCSCKMFKTLLMPKTVQTSESRLLNNAQFHSASQPKQGSRRYQAAVLTLGTFNFYTPKNAKEIMIELN